MSAPYLSKKTIRQHASELLKEYARLRGKPVTFPLDASDMFDKLFGLATIYDDQDILNSIEPGIIGCLFPDGHESPWRRDKVIAINMSRPPQANPIMNPFDWKRWDVLSRNQNFTTAHEGAGHYILHFLKGIGGAQYRRPTFCRTSCRRDPLEWQADFMAGEVITPYEQVAYILDGAKPPAVINVEECWPRYRDYFGANRTMMETRLHVLDYKLINTMNDWANYANEEKQRNEQVQQQLKTQAELERLVQEGTKGFDELFADLKNPFGNLDNIFSDFGTGPFGDNRKKQQKPRS